MDERIITKTSIFLVPMFGKRPAEMGYDYFNSYLTPDHNRMMIAFKNDQKYETCKIVPQSFIDKTIEILKIGKFTIFTVEIPTDRLRDVYTVMEGKYSRISLEYKHKILYIYSPTKKTYANLYKILFPTPEDRKVIEQMYNVEIDPHAEIHSSPYPEREIINMMYFINSYINDVWNKQQIQSPVLQRSHAEGLV